LLCILRRYISSFDFGHLILIENILGSGSFDRREDWILLGGDPEHTFLLDFIIKVEQIVKEVMWILLLFIGSFKAYFVVFAIQISLYSLSDFVDMYVLTVDTGVELINRCIEYSELVHSGEMACFLLSVLIYFVIHVGTEDTHFLLCVIIGDF
jgi:hypothetical protein